MSMEAILSVTIFTLSFLGGAIWWAAALFSEVRAIGKSLVIFQENQKRQYDILADHGDRIVRIETRMEDRGV